jgi:hypothetical protein
MKYLALALASFLVVHFAAEVSASDHDTDATARSQSSFEVRHVADPSEAGQVFSWEFLPDRRAVSIKLRSGAALDASILKSARIARIEEGRYAGYYDIEVLFTDPGADAFRQFKQSSMATKWAFVFSGTVATVQGNAGEHPSANVGPSHTPVRDHLGAILPEAKAQRYVAAINAEIGRRQGEQLTDAR